MVGVKLTLGNDKVRVARVHAVNAGWLCERLGLRAHSKSKSLFPTSVVLVAAVEVKAYTLTNMLESFRYRMISSWCSRIALGLKIRSWSNPPTQKLQ